MLHSRAPAAVWKQTCSPSDSQVKWKPDRVLKMIRAAASPTGRAHPKRGWTLLSTLVLLLVFLDTCAITWYLWNLSSSSFNQLDKTLSTAGGWVSAALTFFGIHHTLVKQPKWASVARQLPVVVIVLAASVLIWFLLRKCQN